MDEIKKTGPKDVFLHLAAMLALYFSAGAFIALLFQYINLGFYDPLEGSRAATMMMARTGIRWSISMLIIVFPAYILITRYIYKQYLQVPEKLDLKIRKWLLYFTLFAASLMIIGNLVALVYNFLGGELTMRFFLKILSMLFVAASVFYYYLMELRTKKSA